MNPPAGRLFLVLLLLVLQYPSPAQENTPYAAWLFPGVSWLPSKNTRLLGQLGYNHYYRTGIVYPQAFITVHKNIVLNPAYIYALQKRKGLPMLQDHYLMNAVILQAARKGLLVDDRNMLWNRLTVGIKARHYYRNRLRVAQTFKIGKEATARLYAFGEVFYLFNDKHVSRNRAAIGASADFLSKINIDITYIRQWDRGIGQLNLFFITGTWQL